MLFLTFSAVELTLLRTLCALSWVSSATVVVELEARVWALSLTSEAAIFNVAPGLLRIALDLIGCARVCEPVVSDRLPDALLDLACYLVELP